MSTSPLRPQARFFQVRERVPRVHLSHYEMMCVKQFPICMMLLLTRVDARILAARGGRSNAFPTPLHLVQKSSHFLVFVLVVLSMFGACLDVFSHLLACAAASCTAGGGSCAAPTIHKQHCFQGVAPWAHRLLNLGVRCSLGNVLQKQICRRNRFE